ncbi:triose-phosphate isomerase [Candidatus Saccharibacteria bacterium]|jgi:triosephosphate isomerase|nr:triose-phosphate isomerase [Candidatus Saccharibacteria bacterium]HOR23597.1 triose-phosphate isomerase [Candidatus Saccharibacteria bacterium]
MSKTLIVGNWKMYLNASQASLLAYRLQEHIKTNRDVEVVLAPSMLTLQPVSLQIDRKKFKLAAQNAFYQDQGAYTGEVSFTMLRDLIHYCIIGHSERRYIFNESEDDITKKVTAAYRNGIIPILCIGETKSERLDGETNRVINDQLVTALANVTSVEVEKLVVAYEPVWSIGTGDFAKPSLVEAAVKVIRKNISALYGDKAAQEVRVLYGGSVMADIAGGYLGAKGVDGLLVGGASLNYQQFSDIVNAAGRKKSKQNSKEG